jgi:hypothetical protein
MRKAKTRKLPLELAKAAARAAAMAAATRGRSRVFKDKRKTQPPARQQIDDELQGL